MVQKNTDLCATDDKFVYPLACRPDDLEKHQQRREQCRLLPPLYCLNVTWLTDSDQFKY